jgi:hypothetical protein
LTFIQIDGNQNEISQGNRKSSKKIDLYSLFNRIGLFIESFDYFFCPMIVKKPYIVFIAGGVILLLVILNASVYVRTTFGDEYFLENPETFQMGGPDNCVIPLLKPKELLWKSPER